MTEDVLPLCAVRTPAGWVEYIHTPVERETKHNRISDEFTSRCSNCGKEIIQFYIEGDEDRLGRWSNWFVPTLKREQENG